jgi:hypothetical protein
MYKTGSFHRITKNGPRPKPGPAGPGEAAGGAIEERTASWPTVSPVWATSFNRATRADVVKTRPAKQGID